jgi:uncharacterized protein (TIGR03083 family)
MTNDETSAPPPELEQLPVNPAHIRDVALIELDKLEALVKDLSLEDWKKMSAVSGWTIGDAVAHMDLALALYARLLEAVSGGAGAGKVWKAFGKLGEKVAPVASPAFNAVNTAIPRIMERALSPEVVKGRLEADARKVRDQLDRLESGDYTRPVYYVGGPYPLSFFMAMMVNEIAVHGWDIESRLRPDAHLDEPACSVLPWFYWSGTPLMLKLPSGTSGTIGVTLTDPAASMWWSLSDGKTGTGTIPDPDVEISGPASPFVLALAGRLPAEDAIQKTLLSVTGSPFLAKTFLESWKIF